MCNCDVSIDEINNQIRVYNRMVEMENMTTGYYIHCSCNFCDNNFIELIFNRLDARECPKCNKIICYKCDKHRHNFDIEWNIIDDPIIENFQYFIELIENKETY
ncbi:MAG: hypothetical protein Edafosvirus3_83 [Edafosvirus sp.]|uniref:Uncharacterized protein n=1 Tax=Edafosvirus sp. TaxID=2487765 RepID=A0A3G4ZSZ6_9VIRU|nr:MAG: hypothetical protein Edafosvirus3_83 [Edafosvirus sp.]